MTSCSTVYPLHIMDECRDEQLVYYSVLHVVNGLLDTCGSSGYLTSPIIPRFII